MECREDGGEILGRLRMGKDSLWHLRDVRQATPEKWAYLNLRNTMIGSLLIYLISIIVQQIF